MHNSQKVVDVHGHMTTPAPFRQFLAETVAQNTPGRKLEMTEEQLENAQQRHLKFMDDRNIDVQFDRSTAHRHVALDAAIPARVLVPHGQ